MTKKYGHIMVTGGAGYVGSNLVPKLLDLGYRVTVLDLYLYGDGQAVFGPYDRHANLRQIKGDLRDAETVQESLSDGVDAVIHLACISNDPSYDLNPDLGKSINYDAFRPLVRASKDVGVKLFVYASSSSVYGIKEEANVHEGMELEPLTDYSKFKVLCEEILEEEREPGFVTLTIRPSTVCGYARRQRLDVVVNILTAHAIKNGKIKVFGGEQLRPNINIEDMTDLYLFCLECEDEKIDGKIYNAGYENHPVIDLANIVKAVVGDVEVEIASTDDIRSYHVSSQRIREELGFIPRYTIEDAVRGLKNAFDQGMLEDPMNNEMYYNIKRMQSVNLT